MPRPSPLSLAGLVALSFFFGSCQNPSVEPPQSPIPLPTAAPIARTVSPPSTGADAPTVSDELQIIVVRIPDRIESHPGGRIDGNVSIEPSLFTRVTALDGSAYTSIKPDPKPRATEMRLCVNLGAECEPTGEWIQLGNQFPLEWKFELDVDWVGERTAWLGASFRDAAGNLVPVLSQDRSSPLEQPATFRIQLNSVIDERTPITAQFPIVQTAVAETRTAYPVTGAVKIQGSPCCAGGKVGSTVEIRVDFAAASPFGSIREMRVANRCADVIEISSAPWEPFVASKFLPVKIASPGFVGWYIGVQYKDEKGNLSPVYCDDISVEGMP